VGALLTQGLGRHELKSAFFKLHCLRSGELARKCVLWSIAARGYSLRSALVFFRPGDARAQLLKVRPAAPAEKTLPTCTIRVHAQTVDERSALGAGVAVRTSLLPGVREHALKTVIKLHTGISDKKDGHEYARVLSFHIFLCTSYGVAAFPLEDFSRRTSANPIRPGPPCLFLHLILMSDLLFGDIEVRRNLHNNVAFADV
jgi:hypothetical protein